MSDYREMSDEELMRAHGDIGDELARRYRESKRKQLCGVRGYTLGGNPDGTCMQGYLTASYQDLVKVLGEPNVEGDGYKVSTEWCITLADGRVVTIYDYKETDLYDSELSSVEEFRALPKYEWHIGGKSGGANLVAEVARLLFGGAR